MNRRIRVRLQRLQRLDARRAVIASEVADLLATGDPSVTEATLQQARETLDFA